MPLNTITFGPPLTDLPEFCGPDELTDAVIRLRKYQLERIGEGYLSPISDAGIRRLIKLAYYTSLVAEEGRYPHFRLICTKESGDSIFATANFEVEIDGVEAFRRLAPSVSETDGALRVVERDGGLHCTGSMIVSEMGFGAPIGRPEIVSGGRSPSLIVRVDGPGCIRATEGSYTYVLEGGRIRQVVDYGMIKQLQGLWDKLVGQMVENTASIYGEDSRKYFPDAPPGLIHKAWSKVLATTIDKHHGGVFVVLPTEGNPEDFGIHCRYPAQMDFGDDILQFWQSCINHATKGARESERAIRRWNWRRAAVFDKAGVLAGLSSVDGCVVLNRNLQVLGFGGVIQVNEQQAQEAARTLKNLKTGEPVREEDALNGLGTRHRSAYRLAKVYPGMIVFVISQDGDLRVFCSDEDYVFGFEHLHAWVHSYESE